MKVKTLIISACALLISASAFPAEKSWEWIKPGRVYDLLKEGSGIWLIDVSSPGSYASMRIEGSTNISVSALRHKKFSKDKVFVLTDTDPGQKVPREAADYMSGEGYKNVYVLEGGVVGWALADYPVVRDAAQRALGVTAGELKWAIETSAPVRIFDVRDENARKGGTVPGSHFVDGGDYGERIERLRDLLRNEKGFVRELAGHETVVLVFSAGDDARLYADLLSAGVKKDVRFLHGGYEVYEATIKGDFGRLRKGEEGSVCGKAK